MVTRERPWNDRTDAHGPFDIIGDVHGCSAELRTLLTQLGWQLEYDGSTAVGAPLICLSQEFSSAAVTYPCLPGADEITVSQMIPRCVHCRCKRCIFPLL